MGSSEDLVHPTSFMATRDTEGVSVAIAYTQSEAVICSILDMDYIYRLLFAMSGGQNRAWNSPNKVCDSLTSQSGSAQSREWVSAAKKTAAGGLTGTDLEVVASKLIPSWAAIASSFFQASCLSKLRKMLIRPLCSYLWGFRVLTACPWALQALLSPQVPLVAISQQFLGWHTTSWLCAEHWWQCGSSWGSNKHRQAEVCGRKPPAFSASSRLTLLLCWNSSKLVENVLLT